MIAACLFALYFVTFKFGSVITDEVTPVAKFKSASSRTKILRLIFFYSNLESNLQILFAKTRTLKMSNLNLRRFACKARQCRHISRAVGLEMAWERVCLGQLRARSKGRRRFVSRFACGYEPQAK